MDSEGNIILFPYCPENNPEYYKFLAIMEKMEDLGFEVEPDEDGTLENKVTQKFLCG